MVTTRTLNVNYDNNTNTLTVNTPTLHVPNQENVDIVWNARGNVSAIQSINFSNSTTPWPYDAPSSITATQWHVAYTNTDASTTTYKYDVVATVDSTTETLDPEIVNAGSPGG